MSKKVIIADVFAEKVDAIWGGGYLTPSIAWIGAILYTLQIYFDFSGYSDMAIGLGRLFGFHFQENFNYPYTSKSITEFWRRWHISLSSWFKDYVYIPMGGSRKGNVYIHLVVVFLLTGLWHGANWTFVLWGVWHCIFRIIEKILSKKAQKTIPVFIKYLYTMFVVIIGWVLFRSDNISSAINYVFSLFGKTTEGFQWYGVLYYLDSRVIITFVLAMLISLGIPKRMSMLFRQHFSRMSANNTFLRILESLFLMGLLVYALSTVVNGNYSPFIYFRF